MKSPQSPLFAKGNKGVNFTIEKPTEDMKNNLPKNLLFTGVDDGKCRDIKRRNINKAT